MVFVCFVPERTSPITNASMHVDIMRNCIEQQECHSCEYLSHCREPLTIAQGRRLVRDTSKSDTRSISSRCGQDDDPRRSRSLDGETTLGSAVARQLDKVHVGVSPPQTVHVVIDMHSHHPSKSNHNQQQQQHGGKKPTPWRIVKDIIQTHRGSLRSKSRSRSAKSTAASVGCSRDVSPCDSVGGYAFAPFRAAVTDVRRGRCGVRVTNIGLH